MIIITKEKINLDANLKTQKIDYNSNQAIINMALGDARRSSWIRHK